MANEATSIRLPAPVVRQVILMVVLAIFPSGAVGLGMGSKLDKVLEGQRTLEEKFARLEGAGTEARVKGLEDMMNTVREHIAGLQQAQKERK